jgi:hypothetical protein
MWGAALLYNLMLAKARTSASSNGSDRAQQLAADYRAALEQWHGAVGRQRRTLEFWGAARADFWVAVKRCNARIPIPSERFINRWIDLSLDVTDIRTFMRSGVARNLIHERERQLKRNLARLDNPRALEMWGGAAGTQRLNYRWPQAQTIVKDILRGLGKGRY